MISDKFIIKKNYRNETIILEIINKCKLQYDSKISNILYEKKYYKSLCRYLIINKDSNLLTYPYIKKNYKNIILLRCFSTLVFYLHINLDDIKDISKIYNNKKQKWFLKRIKKYASIILKIDIHELENL
jgi:hypothetical protein